MNLTNLPSPGTGMNAQKLQIEACKAISSVEISAAHYVPGKTDRADKLRDFFFACAEACNAVAVTATVLTNTPAP